MPRTGITVYDLLLSFPNDVLEYVDIIKDSVENLNRTLGTITNIHVVTKHWSTDSYPQSGGKPQELLNNQFVRECDAAVAVFWTRFGTPTENFGSGTEEEIEEMLRAGKQVFLYFLDKKVELSQVDIEQYKKVQDFRDKYKNKGIYSIAKNEQELRLQFTNHLGLYFTKSIIINNLRKPTLLLQSLEKGDTVKRKLRVFISCTEEDRDQAAFICKELEELGYEPWMEHTKILPGQKWDTAFKNALDQTDAFIVCLSDNSILEKNIHLQRKITYAIKKAEFMSPDDCFLIPIRLNDCEVPSNLERYNYVDLFHPEGYVRLIDALNYRESVLGIGKRKDSAISDLRNEVLIKMVNHSEADAAATAFKEICKNISNGKAPISVLTDFADHPYWLIRKLAIQEIIEYNRLDTMDMLFEFKDVSYHVSQSLIREYIEKRIGESTLNQAEIKKAVIILEHLSNAKRVSETSKKKDLRLLDRVRRLILITEKSYQAAEDPFLI